MGNKAPIGKLLQTNPLVKIGEILFLFILAFAFIQTIGPLVSNNPILKQLIIAPLNILMLIYIWVGLKLRGESWGDFGLDFKSISWKEGFKGVLLSLLVTVLGLAGFIFGGVLMASIIDTPEAANMSGYNYLKDNLGMLLLALVGVYISSSFCEEVIYRAFLINRLSELGQGTKKAIVAAVILSSVIFGLIHFEWGPMGIVQTGFMGLMMGICYIWFKKRLWLLILAHAYMDTILLVQLYLADN